MLTFSQCLDLEHCHLRNLLPRQTILHKSRCRGFIYHCLKSKVCTYTSVYSARASLDPRRCVAIIGPASRLWGRNGRIIWPAPTMSSSWTMWRRRLDFRGAPRPPSLHHPCKPSAEGRPSPPTRRHVNIARASCNLPAGRQIAGRVDANLELEPPSLAGLTLHIRLDELPISTNALQDLQPAMGAVYRTRSFAD